MPLLETMLKDFPIRRTKAQKEAFRAWAVNQAQESGFEAREENCGGHQNVVIGNPEQAEMILTAHYDTPAVSFMENRMLPRNRLAFYLRQAWMVGVYLAISAVLGYVVGRLCKDLDTALRLGYAAYMLLVMLLLFGPANKHNANDNTSGVSTLMALLPQIAPENRSRIAVILFDNEEKGLKGSKAYAKAHPDVKKNGLVINLDCVGVGEHILVLANQKAREWAQYAAFESALATTETHTFHHFPLEGSCCNSDQKNFDHAMAICACAQEKRVGFVVHNIHTPRDTQCSEGNIAVISAALAAHINRVAEN